MVQLNGIMPTYLVHDGYLSHNGSGNDLGDSMDDLSEDLDGKEFVDKEVFDRDLVDKVLAGDTEAQKILIADLTPTIQWEVGKMLRKWRRGSASARDLSQEVEDLTQEAWLAIWEKDCKVLREWKPFKLPLKGWVGYVARSRAAQVLRSPRAQWREEPLAPDDLPNEPGEDSPERSALAKNRLEAIYLCLMAKSGPFDSLLFDLYFIKQQAVKTICEQLDRKRNTVDKWRSRLSKRAEECDEQLAKWSGAPV